MEVVAWPLNNLLALANREDCTEARSIAALYIIRDLLAQGMDSDKREA
jgi:ADP-ribose diphosphatase